MFKPIALRAFLAVSLTPFLHPQAARPQARNESPQEVRRSLHTLPITKFYDTTNLAAGKPGELIRSRQFDEYYLPEDVIAVRILYHSRSADNHHVPVSGVVLYPYGKAPAGGWPVIAWAHAANGVARQCAPSLARNLQHGPFLAMYVKLGYAVVATDYAGLGAASRNAFADAQSNAINVIDSVPAARAAVPGLSAKWVAVGTAEGGSVAVAVDERERELRDANYLGSVVISGLDDPQGRYNSSSPATFCESPLFLAYGIKTVFPEFDPKEILTDKGLSLYSNVDQSCGEPRSAEISSSEMLKSNWASNKFVKQYYGQNALGQQPAQAAILVIVGELNPTIPAQTTGQVVARMCKQGDRVEVQRYHSSDSLTVFGDSVRDQISWIQARFAGKQAERNCDAQH